MWGDENFTSIVFLPAFLQHSLLLFPLTFAARLALVPRTSADCVGDLNVRDTAHVASTGVILRANFSENHPFCSPQHNSSWTSTAIFFKEDNLIPEMP